MSAYDYILANIHDFRPGNEGDVDESSTTRSVNLASRTDLQPGSERNVDDSATTRSVNFASRNETHDDTSTTLLVNAMKHQHVSPADLCKVLSTTMTRHPDAGTKPTTGDNQCRSVNATEVTDLYSCHSAHRENHELLLDRGANGGIAGENVRVINYTGRHVDVRGIDNHQIIGIPIVTAGAVMDSQRGPVIGIMHQYAYTEKGKTIHSCGQLEWFKNDVNDRSVKIPGGLQRILTLDGYAIPINIEDGLPYISMKPYTDEQWDTLPQVILTSDAEWNPTVLDHRLDDNDDWFDAISDLQSNPTTNLFDEFGNYRKRVVVVEHATFFDAVDPPTVDDIVDDCVMHSNVDLYEVHSREITKQEPDYEALRPFFGWLPVDIVKRTFAATTQYARIPFSTTLKKHYKSPFPAFNVHRRDEPVATDTVYSDTPAVDSGATSAQLFVGTETLLTDVYGMKTDKQFVNTLEDNIRERGAMSKLISDRAQVEISNKVMDIVRALFIRTWQSEPQQQQQNPAERRYQTVKTMSNTVLDRTGAPAYTWLLCLMYVCFILNFTVSSALNSSDRIRTGMDPRTTS